MSRQEDEMDWYDDLNARSELPRRDGPAIEVGFGGHVVKIVAGDHPAVRRQAYDRQSRALRGLGQDHRVAWCSCGAHQPFTHPEKSRNANRAEAWAHSHTHHSGRATQEDRKWTRAYGWVPTKASAINGRNDMHLITRRAALAARRDQIELELAALDALPIEPEVDTGEPNVVWFEKSFGVPGGVRYTYAAVRANDDLWYTTGPKAPKGWQWDQLIEWIQADEPEPVEVWWAETWARHT